MSGAGPDAAKAFDPTASAFLLALVLGAATVLGFSPFGLYPLPLATLAGLCYAWRRFPGAAGRLGYAFGLGLFGTGVSWVYVSLHDFGGMPAPVAIPVTASLCAYLALFPAAAGWVAARCGGAGRWRFALVAAAGWTLAEWVRGWLLTGFPWLAVGYSQVPASPLAQVAPVAGVFGVSFALVLTAALIAGAVHAPADSWRERVPALAGAAALAGAGLALGSVAWTAPRGASVTVSLLQGNIPQDLKFRDDFLPRTFDTYLGLVKASASRLIILPESALPLFRDQVPPDYLERIAAHGRGNGGDVLVGMFDANHETGEIFNSMFSFGAAPTQAYRKRHLVPFGEFIPMKWAIGWVYDSILHMPIADQAPGPRVQEPMKVAGERVALSICYEDAFGEEVIGQLPEATLLANVSNDAWFGERIAPWQHTQIAQTRALETGRWMLRATNTGITAIIDGRGRVVAHARPNSATALDGSAQGRAGSTPFVRWGNGPVVGLCLAILIGAWLLSRREGASGPAPAAQ